MHLPIGVRLSVEIKYYNYMLDETDSNTAEIGTDDVYAIVEVRNDAMLCWGEVFCSKWTRRAVPVSKCSSNVAQKHSFFSPAFF